jgi:AcrR family transcriptional regulator
VLDGADIGEEALGPPGALVVRTRGRRVRCVRGVRVARARSAPKKCRRSATRARVRRDFAPLRAGALVSRIAADGDECRVRRRAARSARPAPAHPRGARASSSATASWPPISTRWAGAGVAKGTLYRYFENKAELYVAVLSANGDVFERKMRETIEPALPPAEQVRRLGRFYIAHWTAHREYFQIFWALENEPVIGELPEPVVAQVTALWEQCLRLLSDALERGVREGVFVAHDSWEVANILWTLANGLIQREQHRLAQPAAQHARAGLRGRRRAGAARTRASAYARFLIPGSTRVAPARARPTPR